MLMNHSNMSQEANNIALKPSRYLLSYYDSGIMCSCSSESLDLVEAHKWFNLAATSGDERGAPARGSVAQDMTPREITEAQRRARSFLNSGSTRVSH